jgi:O-antigen/teichoic acid export membrane protein
MTNLPHKNKLSTSASSALQILTMDLSALASVAILARILDVSEYGKYTLINTLVYFLIIFFGLGLPNSCARFIHEHLGSSTAWVLARKSINLFLIIFGVNFLIILGLVFYTDLPKRFDFYDRNLLILSCVIALLEGLRLFVEKISLALNELSDSLRMNLISSVMLLILVSILAYMYGSATAAIVGKCFALALPLPLVFMQMMKRLKSFDGASAEKPPSLYRIFQYGLPIAMVSLAGYGFLQADILLISIHCTPRDVALFSVCAFVYVRLLIVPRAVANGLLPHLLNNTGSGDVLVSRSVTFILLYTGAISVFFIAEGASVLSIAFGKTYAAGSEIFSLLTIYFFMASLMALVNPFLDFSGGAKVRAWGVSIGAIINTVLSFYLIPTYGSVGAVYSTLVGFGVSLLLILRSNHKFNLLSAVLTFTNLKLIAFLLVIHLIAAEIQLETVGRFLVNLVLCFIVLPLLCVGLKILPLSYFGTLLREKH